MSDQGDQYGPSWLRAAYRAFRLMEELRQTWADTVRRYAPPDPDRKAYKRLDVLREWASRMDALDVASRDLQNDPLPD